MPEKPAKKRRLPRKILLRRIVSSTVLLVIVILLVLGIVAVVKATSGLLSNQNLAQSATETDSEQSVGIPNCTAADLNVTLASNPTSIAQGSSTEISITLENQGSEACWMNTSSLQVMVLTAQASTQTSQGSQTTTDEQASAEESQDTQTTQDSVEGLIWPGSECVSDWELPLLLSPGVPWSSEITWDGKVYNECEVSQVTTDGKQTDETAAAGTYIVSAYFSGEQIGQSLTLVVQ